MIFSICYRYVDPNNSIDLLNVAFAKEIEADDAKYGVKFDTPDRVTGKMGYKALKRLFPDRKWNFIEVNINNYSQCIIFKIK